MVKWEIIRALKERGNEEERGKGDLRGFLEAKGIGLLTHGVGQRKKLMMSLRLLSWMNRCIYRCWGH